MKMILRFPARYVHAKSLQTNFIDHKTRCIMSLPVNNKLLMLKHKLLIMFIKFFFCDSNSYHVIKFCEGFYLRGFNFAIFFTIAKIFREKL